MRVELGEGLFIEEVEPGFVEIEAIKAPAKVKLSREEFTRRYIAAIDEQLDPA